MSAADTPGQSPRTTFCPPDSRRFVLFTAILASSMGFIDGSVVSLAMPAIRADLGASLVDAQWISNGYMLFLSALVLLGGAAGDVFGVRNIFSAGIAVFMAMSLACALSTDAQMLIVTRAAQGIGAAFMVPGSLAIIAKAYPPETRGRAIGQWAAFSSLTTAMGPFIGGMVLSFGADWMWRLIFAINVPIGLLALGLLCWRVPRDRPAERRTLDIPGALLATAGLGLMAWGLTSFGLPESARGVSPFVWLAAGVGVFAGFIVWERRARAPMVRLELFRSRAFSGANVFTLVLFFAFNAVLFFLPMTLVSAWGTAGMGGQPRHAAAVAGDRHLLQPCRPACRPHRAAAAADRRRGADGAFLCRARLDHAADAFVASDVAGAAAQRGRHGDCWFRRCRRR